MVQRTVLKVDITCDKNRKKFLQAVSGIRGVDKVEIDSNKGTLSVTGNADPYEIILQTQKAGRFVEVVSVGPSLPSSAQSKQTDGLSDYNKKPDEKKPDQKPQAQVQPKAQPQGHNPMAQPQAQLQFYNQFPTQAHSQIYNPHACPACHQIYMYHWPRW